MYVCMFVSMYVRTYACLYLCTYVRMYVRTYVRTYVCMYVCMYVRTYVCMYVCIMYVCVGLGWDVCNVWHMYVSRVCISGLYARESWLFATKSYWGLARELRPQKVLGMCDRHHRIFIQKSVWIADNLAFTTLCHQYPDFAPSIVTDNLTSLGNPPWLTISDI